MLGTIPSLNGEEPIDTLEEWANRSNEGYALDQRYNYFAYDYENGFFYKYLAREKCKDMGEATGLESRPGGLVSGVS